VNSAFEVGGHGDPLDAEPAARHRIASVVRLQPVRPATVAHPSAVRCSNCRLLAECLPAELERELLDRVDDRLVSCSASNWHMSCIGSRYLSDGRYRNADGTTEEG
jgi:hypothetical protein